MILKQVVHILDIVLSKVEIRMSCSQICLKSHTPSSVEKCRAFPTQKTLHGSVRNRHSGTELYRIIHFVTRCMALSYSHLSYSQVRCNSYSNKCTSRIRGMDGSFCPQFFHASYHYINVLSSLE